MVATYMQFMCSETTGEQRTFRSSLASRNVVLDSKSHSFLACLPTYDDFELDEAMSWSFSLNYEGSLFIQTF